MGLSTDRRSTGDHDTHVNLAAALVRPLCTARMGPNPIRLASLLGVSVVITALLMGCSRGNGDDSRATSTEQVPIPKPRSPSFSSPSSIPPNALTGLGATRAAWRETHAGGGAYDSVNYDSNGTGRVIGFDHNFPGGTTQSTALAEIKSQDLPLDIRQLKSGVGDVCKICIFTSRRLGKVAGDSTISVAIGGDGVSPYDPQDIESAAVTLNYGTGLGSC